MKVPFIDLKREYLLIKKDLNKALLKVLERGEYCYGQETIDFEKNVCGLTNCRYSVAVGSGTEALTIALKALKIGAEDEVVTTPLTFVATAESIVNVGARPVFVDVEEETMNLDINQLELVISKKTKAILPVHLYGVCLEMDKLLPMAKKFKLPVMEDASHSFGSFYKGKSAGSWGDVGCFSLYPTKTLGAYGNAGVIITNRKLLFEKMKKISNHGRGEDRNLHELIGYTGTIDNIQSAILNIKMKKLKENIKKRKAITKRYNTAFQSLPFLKLPSLPPGSDCCPYVYTIRTEKREALRSYLSEKGIGTGIYYSLPLHLQPSLKFLGYKKGDFPLAERAVSLVLSLPLFPEMTEREVDYVIDSVKDFKRRI